MGGHPSPVLGHDGNMHTRRPDARRRNSAPGWLASVPETILPDGTEVEQWLLNRGLPRPSLLDLESERVRRTA